MLLNLPKANPIVSVILPTYNRRRHLCHAINSVIHQSFRQWELIIIDDGSEDNSWEIIENYMRKFNQIRGVRHSNKGASLSRNVGMKIACGNYLTFIDSDDRYHRSHLDLRLRFMLAHPKVDIIHGGFKIIGDPYVADKNNPQIKIHMAECPLGGTIFGKAEAITRLGGFRDLAYSEDSEFLERAQKSCVVSKVNFPTYIYDKTTSGSITNSVMRQSATA